MNKCISFQLHPSRAAIFLWFCSQHFVEVCQKNRKCLHSDIFYHVFDSLSPFPALYNTWARLLLGCLFITLQKASACWECYRFHSHFCLSGCLPDPPYRKNSNYRQSNIYDFPLLSCPFPLLLCFQETQLLTIN